MDQSFLSTPLSAFVSNVFLMIAIKVNWEGYWLMCGNWKYNLNPHFKQKFVMCKPSLSTAKKPFWMD